MLRCSRLTGFLTFEHVVHPSWHLCMPRYATETLHAGSFNLTALNELCESTFGVTPDPDYAAVQYGGRDYSSASNIVFSNGEFDPWRTGKFEQTPSLNSLRSWIDSVMTACAIQRFSPGR